jgi:YidC/Oxa1 family membrane protein insertase
MSSIISLIGTPLGWIMWMFYRVIQNYGLTLVLFTVFTRILMIPLAINQQKGMIKMAKFRPKMEEIQKKYANNKQRLNEELMALYQKENYSPTASCLPLMIQFPILFGLMDVMYYPIKHILRLAPEVISQATEIAAPVLSAAGLTASRYSAELSVLNAVKIDIEPFVAGLGADTANLLASLDINFLGMNLGEQPQLWPITALMVIPVLSGVTSALLSYVSMLSSRSVSGGKSSGSTDSMSSAMLFTMPLFSVYISFQVPAGVGFYWLLTNTFMTLQSYILYKVYNPGLVAAREEAAEEAAREDERQRRIENKKAVKEGILAEADERTLSQKEINRIKLAEARRRDAEKYGEEYVDVTDDDLK